MALDGIYIYSILCELKNKFIGSRISKINQPEKDELNFLIRGIDNKNYRLLISASSSYPKIHITDNSKKNPLTPPMFCMVLRKYLLNSKIVDIRQIETDRIIIFDFQSVDDLGFNSIYSLIIEIMGRHSNVTLVRARDNIVMDSIKHITPEINRFRSLYPGIEYVYPPKSERLNPFNFSREDFLNYLSDRYLPIDEKMCSKVFIGVSKSLSKEIMFRLQQNVEEGNINPDTAYGHIDKLFTSIKNCNFSYNIYSENGIIKDFSCIDLTSLDHMNKVKYNSSSELLENFYFEKDKADRLNNHSIDLQRIVNTNLDRCLKKDEILNKKLIECQSKDKYRLYGELLTANIYVIKKGDKNVTLQNYYSDDLKDITIQLNENKTPSENIQAYFKKYNKLKTTEKMAKIQLEANSKEIDYLQSVFTNIKNCEDYSEIEEIKKELIDTGYIKFNKKNNKKSPKVSKPYHFISSDGIDIYVGKNNFQNDYLTLKFADKKDIWMHTKNIPGSHVIIKNRAEPLPDKTLEEAAGLAAYYSKAKHSNNVAVDYTEVKNVKKPSGAKPGMVIYLTNRTVNIMPKKLTPVK